MGLAKYAEIESRKTTFTRQDLDHLQSLQRQAGLLYNPPDITPPHHPTAQVLKGVGWLSIHQLIAYHTLSIATAAVRTGKPSFLATQLKPKAARSKEKFSVPRCRLSLTQEDFVVDAAHLLNKLADHFHSSPTPVSKDTLKEWVFANILVKP